MLYGFRACHSLNFGVVIDDDDVLVAPTHLARNGTLYREQYVAIVRVLFNRFVMKIIGDLG